MGSEMCIRDSDSHSDEGCGREFFAVCRDNVSGAEQGASFLFAGYQK